MSRIVTIALGIVFAWAAIGSSKEPGAELQDLATSKRQWTGVTVTAKGRVFVNFPRWSDQVPVSVGKFADGQPLAFPDEKSNQWNAKSNDPSQWVCVQSVVVDQADRLWVLDPANPQFEGVVDSGPKLVMMDPESGQVLKPYRFDQQVAKPDSYLNDVRIDLKHQVAYITDSGNGALVVLDLSTGKARRLLDEHPSTHSEGITLIINSQPWLQNGQPPAVHADGIAYCATKDRLYYQALTGRTLYYIDAADLRDPSLSDDQLAKRIQVVGKTGAADGIICDDQGRIYLSGLESDSINVTDDQGNVQTLVKHQGISWPDTFAWGSQEDGKRWLYFTTSRIQEGDQPTQPYGLHRIAVPMK